MFKACSTQHVQVGTTRWDLASDNRVQLVLSAGRQYTTQSTALHNLLGETGASDEFAEHKLLLSGKVKHHCASTHLQVGFLHE